MSVEGMIKIMYDQIGEKLFLLYSAWKTRENCGILMQVYVSVTGAPVRATFIMGRGAS